MPLLSKKIDELCSALASVSYAQNTLSNIEKSIQTSLLSGNKLIFAGNGGSASDASHLAGEFIGRFKNNRRPLAALSLACDSAVLSCIANDYDYKDIFSRQLEALCNPNDIFFAISTSGRSDNILNAVITAKEKNAKIISLTGLNGKKLEELSDITFKVNSYDTAVIQTVYMFFMHTVCELIDDKWAKKNG